MNKLFIGLLLLISSSGLSGCYESMDVTLHEPGEYKGEKDPLLSTMKQQQFREKLNERFKAGQSDR